MLLLLVVALVRLCLTAPAALHQTGAAAAAEATACHAMQGLAMVAGVPPSSLAPRYVGDHGIDQEFKLGSMAW